MSINFKFILKGFAAIVILLLLCFITFYFITVRRANHVPIPNNAVWVIKIDGINAIKKLWQNAFEWKAPTEESKHTTKGMSMPLHIYIYNTTNCPNAFFTSLLLNDEHLLHSNLIKQEQWKLVDSINHLYINEEQNIALTYNRQYATIAWNIQEPLVIDQLMAISANTNTTKYADTKYIDILVEDHLISITDIKSHVYLDFEKGHIAIGGSLYGLKSNDFKTVNVDSENNIIRLFNNITIKDNEILQTIFGKINMPWIKNRFAASSYSFDLQICEPDITYAQKIRSYEYDDNFEKTEVITEQEKTMPSVQILWKESSEDTVKYAMIKQLPENEFPLFPFYIYPSNNRNILWSNNPKAQYPNVLADNSNCFLFDFDIQKAKQNTYFNPFQKYLEPLTQLHIEGKFSQEKVLLNGRIVFTDQNTNSLQIIRNWWNSR